MTMQFLVGFLLSLGLFVGEVTEPEFERIWTGSFRMTTERMSYAGFDCEQMVFWQYKTPEPGLYTTYSLRLFIPEGALADPGDHRVRLNFADQQVPQDELVYPHDSLEPAGSLVFVFPDGDEVAFDLDVVHFMHEHPNGSFWVVYWTKVKDVPGFTRRLLTETQPVELRIEGDLGVAEYVIRPEVLAEFERFRTFCFR
jgi:hypothetical protein